MKFLTQLGKRCSRLRVTPILRHGRMLDGFNEGWVEFEGGESGSMKGEVELETVLKELVEQ